MIEEGSGPATPPTPDSFSGSGHLPDPEPLLPRLFAMFGRARAAGGKRWWKNRWARRAVAVVVLAGLIGIGSQGIARVRENEVGVRVDELSGNLALEERVGYHVFIPFLQRLYVLDRTIQRLDLGWKQGIGAGSKDLKLMTADGSSVSLDVMIHYKLIPEKAVEVLQHSGQGTRFTESWVEQFARQICLNSFGQLSTEEMYDAAKRNERAQAALTEMNGKLGLYGIEVVAVSPGEFRFYAEYEKVIQDKKLADQQVEQQQAEARAAQEKQERQLVEANKQAQARLAGVQGECENQLIEAKAAAEKTKREADGNYAALLLKADADLYAATKQALGTKATMLAQAEGMEQMRKAMIGDGGLSMIGMEYAKRLAKIRFSATPIAREPSIQQFAVQPEAAAATTTEADSSSSRPVRAMPTPAAGSTGVPAVPGSATVSPPGQRPAPRPALRPDVDLSRQMQPNQPSPEGAIP
jgi:regulator of protease activity HflC (stomatin/prohibitin superfamily)